MSRFSGALASLAGDPQKSQLLPTETVPWTGCRVAVAGIHCCRQPLGSSAAGVVWTTWEGRSENNC